MRPSEAVTSGSVLMGDIDPALSINTPPVVLRLFPLPGVEKENGDEMEE